jgi:foldase protein PrsA
MKRLAGLVLGLAVVLAVVASAASGGLGDPDVPDDAVAVVEEAPDGTVTEEEFQSALERTVRSQGLRNVPDPSNPQYEVFRDTTLDELILTRWIRGEAEDRGIEASEREIDRELERLKEQQFGGERGFQQFLEESGMTVDEARDRIELSIISQRIESSVVPQDVPIEVSAIETFYEQNLDSFRAPESRDVRVILNPDRSKIEQAQTLLERDDSPQSWERVAKRFSTDDATKDSGGLRRGIIDGQPVFDPVVTEEVFAAAEGELVGPIEGESGFYLFQVINLRPEAVTPLADVSQSIRAELVSQRQQQLAQAFQDDFVAKWRDRTFCAEGFEIPRCLNVPPPPDACAGDDPGETLPRRQDAPQCDAPVGSTHPAPPGRASSPGPFPPQGPCGFTDLAAQEPVPCTPAPEPVAGGAQGLPPGVPPGLVPQGGTGQVPGG